MTDFRKNKIKAIDVHAHFGKGACSYKTETEELVRYMDRLGIEWAIGSAFEAFTGDYVKGNEFAAQQVQSFRDRLRAYLIINPNYIENMEAYIDSVYDTGIFVGLKLHTDIHGHSPMSEDVLKIYEYAEEHSLPILSHNFGSFDMAGKIALMFPRLKMIMAHGTARIKMPNHISEYEEVRALSLKVKDRKDFYIDTATSVIPYGANELFARLFGPERILFGTDMGFIDPAYSLARVLGGDFNEEDKKMILRDNAAKLFNIR